MQANVGGIDRLLRIVVGAALIVWGFMAQNYIIMAIGLIPLATGIIKWCPAYTIFGIKTCKADTDNAA